MLRLEPERSESDSLLGAVALLGAGALIGATVALFLAPKSGEQLRTDLREAVRRTTAEPGSTEAGEGV